jgi:condensin complex subunit 3
MPGQVASRGQSETKAKLFENISRIFDQAQTSLANHQKNFVALYKLHKDAATHTEPTDDGRGLKLVGEREFEDVLLDMVFRILPLKKGISQADKIVKFVGGYVKFINEKGALCQCISNAILYA